MTNSIIAIKGNHLDKQTEIFEIFRYIDLKQDRQFDNLTDMYAYVLDNGVSFSNHDITLFGIWASDDWTLIYEPEMVNVLDGAALLKLSHKFNSNVMTFLIQTTSGSFGFAKYSLAGQRQFLSIDGKITDDTGLRLPEELGLNINEKIFIDDITGLARKFGIDFEKATKQICVAKQLGYNEELERELQPFKPARLQVQSEKTKPWWKVW